MDLFFEMLQVSLGVRESLSRIPAELEWHTIYETSKQQAVSGIMLAGLERLPAVQRPSQMLLLQWIGVGEMILRRNQVMNEAVVTMCKKMSNATLRILVFKGQTLMSLYDSGSALKGLRQSGDIDFLVHSDDWEKTLTIVRADVEEGVASNYVDNTTEKDVEYEVDGVQYEMHRMMTQFSQKKHQRYWEEVVMPEIWATQTTVKINDYEVPTLSPVYNTLYVFAHIFEHLISDGIGLRQFVDWYVLIASSKFKVQRAQSVEKDELKVLEKHLKGVGLYDAFCGLGAVLTDYLGLEEKIFPFSISDKDHKYAPKLVENIMKMGNFGHNQAYSRQYGIIHGIEHLGRICGQAWRFGQYAPGEAWCKIPYMFRWWGQKVLGTKKYR